MAGKKITPPSKGPLTAVRVGGDGRGATWKENLPHPPRLLLPHPPGEVTAGERQGRRIFPTLQGPSYHSPCNQGGYDVLGTSPVQEGER